MKKRGTVNAYELLVVVGAIVFLVVLVTVVFPIHAARSEGTQAKGCIGQLQQIFLAKSLWQEEHEVKSGARCTRTDLLPYLETENRRWPKCPNGGTYRIREAGKYPTCSIKGHTLD